MSTISERFLSSKASSKVFRGLAVTAIAPWVLLGLVDSVQAAPSATLTGISRGKFNCMRQNTATAQGSIAYDRGNRGNIKVFQKTVFGPSHVGTFNFNFVPTSRTLTVTWASGVVTTEQLSEGLRNTANNTCKNIQ
jgi:hypothetical protein